MRKPLETLADLAAPFDPIIARAWLMGPGDLCPICVLRQECRTRVRCLHLEASAGLTARTDGPWRRVPLTARGVGAVLQGGTPLLVRDDLARLGLADEAWLRLHAARSFAAAPIPGERGARGALALFSRRDLTGEDLRGLAAIGGLFSLALGVEERTLREIEREAIERALARTGGRVSGPRGAARTLGLKPTTLHSRMAKLGVRRLGTPRTDP